MLPGMSGKDYHAHTSNRTRRLIWPGSLDSVARAVLVSRVANSWEGTEMNQYLENYRACMDSIKAMHDAEQDPRRKAIALNFQRHVALELAGQGDKVLQPDMTVDDPVYRVKMGPEVTTFDGMDMVKVFYEGVNAGVCTFQDATCWVNDWGIASYYTAILFKSAKQLASEGIDNGADDDTMFAQHLPMAMFWPFDEGMRLIGEHVYLLGDSELHELKEGEMFEIEELRAVAREYV